MADPIDPNLNNSKDNVSSSQTDIAKELSSVLDQVYTKLERINQLTRSQSDFITSMTQNFQIMQNSIQSMSENSNKMSTAIEKASTLAMEKFSEKNLNSINTSLEKVTSTYEKASNKQKDSMKKVSKNITTMGNVTQIINENLKKSTIAINNSLSRSSSALGMFAKVSKSVHESILSLSKDMSNLSKKIKDISSGYKGLIKKGMSLGVGLVKNIMSLVGSLATTAAKFVKFSLTVPFTITKAAVSIGNSIRRELVEVIQSASEALKEKFDMDSDIGKGIQAMTARGKGMLLAFKNPSAELVKLFGFGSEGIANMIGFMGENIDAMGHFSEMFGRSLMGDPKRLKNFAKMVKGMGLSAEDLSYLALDSATNLKHINVRMAEMGVTLESVSKEFTVDRKRLSKNFMIMRKDITQFGHLSDEEIAKTTARLTQMRVKLEDASAVFKKFSTFEDAANSVAVLSQTFGMNLDAMDIIKAKNPEDIINMFRESMLETGRSFSDLNRFEKDLMAQHTGMSAESLSALMNYRDLGLTHQEAIARMESEKPTAKQQAAIKKLNSAIKEVQKIMTFDSPFKAFFEGLSNNVALSKELRGTLTTLSSGYQGIYEYALKLDPNTWSGLIKPIKLIIDIMSNIIRSDAFKGGLVNTISAISNFVGRAFGATKSDVILSKLEVNVATHMQSGKLKTKEQRAKFKKLITKKVKEMKDNGMLSVLSLKVLGKKKDPLEIIRYLNQSKQSLDPKQTARLLNFDIFMENTTKTISDEFDKSETKVKGKATGKLSVKAPSDDPSKDLAGDILKTGKDNMLNTKKLFKLSGGIAGAVIKGAAIGFTAILRLINSGMESLKEASDRGEFDGTNMFESFLHFKPGELGQIGSSIGDAVSDFFFNVDTMKNTGSLLGWLVGGIKDTFGLLIGTFGDILAEGINEIFGKEIFKPSRQSLMRKSTLKGLQTKDTSFAQGSIQSVQESFKKSEGFKEEDIANLIEALNIKIKTVEDEKTRADLYKKVNVYKEDFMSKDSSYDGALVSNVLKDMSSISGGKFYGSSKKSLDKEDLVSTQEFRYDNKFIGKDFAGRDRFKFEMTPKYSTPEWMLNSEKIDKLINQMEGTDRFKNLYPDDFENIIETHKRSKFGLDENYLPYEAQYKSYDFNNKNYSLNTRNFLTDYSEQILNAIEKTIQNSLNNNILIDESYLSSSILSNPNYKQFISEITNGNQSYNQTMKIGGATPPLRTINTTSQGEITSEPSLPSTSIQADDLISGMLSRLKKSLSFSNSRFEIIRNLTDSITVPNISESSLALPMTAISSYDASNIYNESNDVKIDKSGKILKRDIDEKANLLLNKTKEAKEKPVEVDGNVILDVDLLDKIAEIFIGRNFFQKGTYSWLTQGVVASNGKRSDFNKGDGNSAFIEGYEKDTESAIG